jgi:uncharacterized protein
MELLNSFVVPSDVETAWKTLLDVESIAPAMPGATLTAHRGDEFDGSVKVKLGPVSMIYNGTAHFVEKNEAEHRVVIDAAGKDTRGTSTAHATVVTALFEETPERTRVEVKTDLSITGRPAQFGRGVMQDVAGRIVDQFAANLSTLMSGPPVPAPAAGKSDASAAAAESAPANGSTHGAASAGSTPEASTDAAPYTTPPMNDSLDLLDAAGAPVLKRLAPVLVVVAAVGIVWWLTRRRR